MANISKSKYVEFCICNKYSWLSKYKSELILEESNTTEFTDKGKEVGELAKGLFKGFVDVTTYDGDSLDIKQMLERTKDEINKGTKTICEAAFLYNNAYCAIDILKKEKTGYSLYEVKSSTKLKDSFYTDVAYQKYVVEHCGIKINSCYIIYLNKGYIKNGDLDLEKLFNIVDVTDDIQEEYDEVELNIKDYNDIMDNNKEPDTFLCAESCGGKKECPFWHYCAKDIPEPSVFDLYDMRKNKKFQLYNSGIVSFEDVHNSNINLSNFQQKQVDSYMNNLTEIIDKQEIRDFLDKISFPLYFLDFETMEMPIPEYDGTIPYQQVPFQYSLHYIEKEGGELKHKEFLAETGKNPLRDIAESLCNNIPMDVCVTAYFKKFECTRLAELASIFPDLSEHLLNIKDHVVDFLDPFKYGYYYNKGFGNSCSIKVVLPTLFPNDPTLDYHNLKGCVHNGGEAMNIFPQLKNMTKSEQAEVRESLLRYCELDTYAMVKVWEELKRVAK